MGGNALSVPSKRVSREEYFQIEDTIITHFMRHGIFTLYSPSQFADKESFGDIDLVISSAYDKAYIEQTIKKISNELVKNGPTWSFNYNGFQVDFVFSKNPNYTTNWMSYGDSANIAGRILHKLGMKHGHEELYLPVWYDDTFVGDVSLTDNLIDVYKFIDLDTTWWESEEFANPTEVFEWVSKSKYFNPDIYLLDNRNAKARYRDSKRPMYTALLEWCEKHSVTLNRFEFNRDKSVYLPLIFEAFPHAKVQYDRLIDQGRYNKSVRVATQEKANSAFIMELTSLTGKELGAFIRNVWENIPVETLLSESKEEIRARIEQLWSNYVPRV